MKMYLQIPILYDMLVWYELNYSIAPNQGKGGNYHGKSLLLLQVARQKWKQPFTRYELNKKRTVKPNLQKFALWSTENLKSLGVNSCFEIRKS